MPEAHLCRSIARRILALLLVCIAGSASGGEAIRFEVPLLPALARHADLFAYPGFLAVALENVGLSPSMSSRLQVREGGRAVEIRNASLRFVSRKGSQFTYEAAVTLDLAVSQSKLAFPVTFDLAQVASGRGVVTLTPPLASLVPAELVERIHVKTGLIANASAQQRMLDYLDAIAGASPPGARPEDLALRILVEAYNKGGGPRTGPGGDAGDAVPVSEQWMLLLTCLIWFVALPGILLYRRLRSGRARPA
jgi:hypothetical protein